MHAGGNMDYGSQVASKADCAAACDQRSGCGSFEWSANRYAAHQNNCNLNTQSDASGSNFLDFIFCSKNAPASAFGG